MEAAQFLFIVWAGFMLDLLLGDPHFLPHPVRAIGWWIKTCEGFLRKCMKSPFAEKMGGVVLVVLVVGGAYATMDIIIRLSIRYGGAWAGIAVQIWFIYQLFATKCLGNEGMKIHGLLSAGNLEGARRAVSFLVSRDVDHMTAEDVTKAAVETVSENIIDGITSPMLYLFIGGVPLAYAFKAINTLDSMVGYKNDRYLHFGWASARLDDVVNWIPARLTGVVLSLAAGLMGYDVTNALRIMWRDRGQHSSPNSPWSEAPTAGALGIRLGGRTSYFGVMYDKPTMGDPVEEPEAKHIVGSVRIMYGTALVSMVLLSLIWFVFSAS